MREERKEDEGDIAQEKRGGREESREERPTTSRGHRVGFA